MASDPSLGFLTRKDTEVKLPRPTRVKNKTPAPIQITADQILREARERQEAELRPPKQKITDPTELADYRLRKRKEFEDLIGRVQWNNISVWIKYAQWEESHKDFARARSVWERALEEVDYRNHTLWLKYAEMEMKNKFINHARNVWDRAVSLLPRVDQLWYKYIHMEEMLGNVAGARQVFERWMGWMPDQQGWLSYIKFELRYNEIERARCIFERFVQCHPKLITAWIRYAKFESKNGEIPRARNCYERAVEKLADDDDEEAEQLFVAFSEFEERCKETERTRCIYKFALDRIPKGRAEDLYRKFVAFEKQYGDKQGIEDAIVGKRRFQDAIGKAPKDKLFKKYIEIELQLGNIDGCRKLYEKYLEWSPENCYAWCKYAELERSLDETERARAIFELAIARPSLDMPEVLWKAYIDFEISECNFDRTRELYERLLDRTKHLKEELDLPKDDPTIQCARRVFEKAINYYRTCAPELKEERAMLLEEWKKMESRFGDVSLVQSKMPKKLKKRRQIENEDGSSVYIDYLFPEPTNLKILEAAYRWKKQKVAGDHISVTFVIVFAVGRGTIAWRHFSSPDD
ncbi:hypothetical protein QQ045_012076 [Rhodiola kirilowii]